MTSRDMVGLLASYGYAGGLLALGEALRRVAGVSGELTRKLIHIGAGMWVFGVLALFDTWQWGVVPFASFVPINYLIYRYRLLGAMDDVPESPGTAYFALSVTLLFALLWRPEGPADRAPVAAAGVMAMTWGDALAALVGRRWGRLRYRVIGGERSLEGSAAMFAASTVAILLTLVLLPGSRLAPFAPPVGAGGALAAALVGAAAATAAEAVSPRGTDNLSAPVIAAVAAGALLAWVA